MITTPQWVRQAPKVWPGRLASAVVASGWSAVERPELDDDAVGRLVVRFAQASTQARQASPRAGLNGATCHFAGAYSGATAISAKFARPMGIPRDPTVRPPK
ncbi:MAG: hypothetical protein ACRC0L_11945 [Angustibacter sp.]